MRPAHKAPATAVPAPYRATGSWPRTPSASCPAWPTASAPAVRTATAGCRRRIHPPAGWRNPRHPGSKAWRSAKSRRRQRHCPPYLVLAILMVVIASAIAITRYPPLRSDVTPEGSASPFSVLRKPRVLYAVVAQFFYVGAQVGTWSLLVDFAQEAAHVPERTGAQVYLEATMIAFCVGRFVGAWLQRTINPPRQLMLYAGCNILLCLAAATLGGFPSIWALVATSFFMSIMFPTIFALGLEGLGH